MIISIQSKVVDGPWGGGNLFVQNLVNYLTSNGLKVLNNLYNPKIDLILMTDPLKQSISTNFSFKQISYYKKYINPNVKIVHRVNECDERKNTNNVNKEIIHCNSIADSTIFVSNWLMNLFENIGLHNNNKVINSGSNRDIFNNLNKPNWDGFSNIKIVTHHWGANWNKGFAIYTKLDELLSKSEYKEKLEFTYIGNLPSKVKFQNSSVVNPLSGKALANEVKNHHAYLTGSLNEPSGNHHIEGAQCGLPILYIDSGGIPEYCENYGLKFTEDNFENILQEFIINFSKLKSNMHTYPHDSDQMCSEYENLFIKLLESREQIVKVRKTPYRINILDQIIYLISRKLNLEFKKFKVRFSK